MKEPNWKVLEKFINKVLKKRQKLILKLAKYGGQKALEEEFTGDKIIYRFIDVSDVPTKYYRKEVSNILDTKAFIKGVRKRQSERFTNMLLTHNLVTIFTPRKTYWCFERRES